MHAASLARVVPAIPHPITTRGIVRRGHAPKGVSRIKVGGVDAHVRQHLYALYAMWREGIGSPLAYPSVVCPLPHARSHAEQSRQAPLVFESLLVATAREHFHRIVLP